MTSPVTPGTLFLIPVPLGKSTCPDEVLPPPVLEIVRRLDHFVVENAKSARAFLKSAEITIPLQSLNILELNEHTPTHALDGLLTPLLEGCDLGLLSEAGCPAIADPGASLVALAQAQQIRVVPLVGPSSILLALMASGLNGQTFTFHGYLPAKEGERTKALKDIEGDSRRHRRTHIFIETPYRNRQLMESILTHCHPSTKLSLATNITLPDESITTRTVKEWKRIPKEHLDKSPTVFLLMG